MAVSTGSRAQSDISQIDMVDIAVNRQLLVGMAVQTIGRIRTKTYRIYDFLTSTVVTGGAGTGTVRGYIMFGSFNFSPARNDMTTGTERTRRIIGKVTGSHLYRVGMSGMNSSKRICMTGRTVTARGEGLRVGAIRNDQAAFPIMTAGTAVMRICCAAPKRIVMTARAGSR